MTMSPPQSWALELQAILAGLCGGARYGFKIRLPHALVMTMLFRQDLTSRQKLVTVGNLVLEHSKNLATFAALYKAILTALKWASRRLHKGYSYQHASHESILQSMGRTIITWIVDGPYRGQRLVSRAPGHPERSHHSIIAGAVGGYVVWGRYSGVNYQIVLYLASRVLVAVTKRIHDNHSPWKVSFPFGYRIFAAVVWGLVMNLFEECPEMLHPSLKRSMDEIYRYSFASDTSPNDSLAEDLTTTSTSIL